MFSSPLICKGNNELRICINNVTQINIFRELTLIKITSTNEILLIYAMRLIIFN